MDNRAVPSSVLLGAKHLRGAPSTEQNGESLTTSHKYFNQEFVSSSVLSLFPPQTGKKTGPKIQYLLRTRTTGSRALPKTQPTLGKAPDRADIGKRNSWLHNI